MNAEQKRFNLRHQFIVQRSALIVRLDVPARLARATTILGILFFAAAFMASAEEPPTIGDIHAMADAYHLREVVLEGTVQDLKLLDSYTLPSGLTCQGAYRFSLQDETGSLDIMVPGWCGKQLPKEVTVANGHRVSVKLELHAPGRRSYSLDMKGQRLETDDADHTHGIAKTITQLGQ